MAIALDAAGPPPPTWSWLKSFQAEATGFVWDAQAAQNDAWALGFAARDALASEEQAHDRIEEALRRGDSEEALRALGEARAANKRGQQDLEELRGRVQRASRATGGVSDMLRAFGDKLRGLGLRPGGRR